ncbi:PREDICTED: exonuclease DPD1, chloroplastic/mitochondrial [Camelina sativa]|uniref:Exonuclease DPD1, chloroplastic/mitochondrial n=1 Tax=Camelina sativa TaxID=90675 RepID=A0ABM0T6E3_CAMSA|nr:PREDICTED: exonuclease DPD1, chloroplastic/mitochondrial [Camelina sativa]XP_010421553.1 PREDICTED: exonuclease DPD1, chloroplastic/mitochondrial [Camelina sativa]XP_010421554.1 PREDICTED: exonuclease DPD1, chloroplastic/mitochondrial [Camelina sativa]
MCVSISQVSRLSFHSFGGSCCERVHGWLKSSSSLKLLDVRASSVDGKARWVRRNVSTTTQGSRSNNTKSSVLGGTIPVTRIIDEESRTKIQQQPFGNLQQRLSQDKDLPKLLTVIVSDLETTGFNRTKERIIEIAAQDLAGGENSTFQTLVNPGEVPVTNTNIHGIRNDMVRRPEVPRMEDLIPIFLRYVESRQKPGGYVMVVAHNGKAFDFQFLINEFNRCSFEIPHNWLLLDSLPLGREHMKIIHPTVKPKAGLEVLAEHYSLTRDGDAHRALSDVLLLSQVFQKLTIDLKLSVSDLVLRSHTASDIATAMAKNKKA